MGMKGVCKLVSRVLKTCFLLAELDTLMSHRSQVFYTRFQNTHNKKLQTQKEKKKTKKKERRKPRRKKEEEDQQQRRRPTAHTNPVSIKHIPIVDVWYSSRSLSLRKRTP